MTGESYLLPASMGGHKCEIVRRGPGDCASVEYEIDGTKVFSTVEDSWLTPVEPAQDEPRYDAQALIDALVAAKLAGSRGDGVYRYWFRSNEQAAEVAWRVADRFFAPLLAALPDPLAGEPVTLPWQGIPGDVSTDVIRVDRSNAGVILTIERIGGAERWIWLDRKTAVAAARAVWAAANQTDKAD